MLVRILTVPGGFGGYWEALGAILRVTGRAGEGTGSYWEDWVGSVGALGAYWEQWELSENRRSLLGAYW